MHDPERYVLALHARIGKEKGKGEGEGTQTAEAKDEASSEKKRSCSGLRKKWPATKAGQRLR